ncbi:hypothetical protein OL239_16670 [Arthrobacter sp. ATA002]|uniref:hypothetical protein n=1 Tax=Arthrobacter sp. ATA002 TaxID=2991715 RepID=UPI0022A7189C|nr:hypothetical protein [Arthrobacter sp. ATA002]WAP51432.1 hypothetical protein OL239_16670 [Arthrobacter sp. ATA002]
MLQQNVAEFVARRMGAVQAVVAGGQQDDGLLFFLNPQPRHCGNDGMVNIPQFNRLSVRAGNNVQQFIKADPLTQVKRRHGCFRGRPFAFFAAGLPKSHCH